MVARIGYRAGLTVVKRPEPGDDWLAVARPSAGSGRRGDIALLPGVGFPEWDGLPWVVRQGARSPLAWILRRQCRRGPMPLPLPHKGTLVDGYALPAPACPAARGLGCLLVAATPAGPNPPESRWDPLGKTVTGLGESSRRRGGSCLKRVEKKGYLRPAGAHMAGGAPARDAP